MKKRGAAQEWGRLRWFVYWGCWLMGLCFMVTVAGGQENGPIDDAVLSGDPNLNTVQFPAPKPAESIWDLTLGPPQTESSAALQRLVVQAMGLSAEQQAELRHLRIDMAEDLQWLHDQSKRQALSDQGTLLRYRAVLEKYRVLRDSLLTDAQVDLMERAQWQMVRRPRRAFISAEFPLVQVLGLSKSQQAQAYSLLEKQQQKLLALQESNAALDVADHVYAMEEMRVGFESMLTPSQAKKLGAVRTAWQEYRQRQTELKYMIEAVMDTEVEVED